MKRLILFFQTVYDNLFRNIILLVGCFLSCALLLSIFYCSDEYTTVLSYAQNGHIEDYVFVSGNLSSNDGIYENADTSNTNYALEDALKTVGGMEISPFVANLQVVDSNHFDADGENLMLNVAYPGMPSFNDMKLELSEGRLPEAKNEIVLCYEAKPHYSLNETIMLNYIDFHGDYVEFHPISVRVVGFLMNRAITKDVTNFIQRENGLDDIFNRYSSYEDIGYLDGFLAQPFDYTDDGVPVSLRFSPNILTCRATDGRTPDELSEDILKAFPGLTESTITGSALKEHYWQANRQKNMKLIIGFILSIMIICCFLIGSLYLQARTKALEISVLYAHGMTWGESTFLICASYFPGILLGILLGIFFFFANAEQRLGIVCNFHFAYVAWTCLICLGISILCSLPIYIRMAYQSPIEIIRRD